MAIRDTFVTIADGDQLNEGYFNGIKTVTDSLQTDWRIDTTQNSLVYAEDTPASANVYETAVTIDLSGETNQPQSFTVNFTWKQRNPTGGNLNYKLRFKITFDDATTVETAAIADETRANGTFYSYLNESYNAASGKKITQIELQHTSSDTTNGHMEIQNGAGTNTMSQSLTTYATWYDS